MNPITNVTKTSNVLANWGSPIPANIVYVTKTFYRQKKPYNLNLPYSRWGGYVKSWRQGYTTAVNCDLTSSSSVTGCHFYSHVNGKSQNTTFTAANQLVSDIQTRARERFVQAMKGNAGLGVDLVEARQSMSMIEKRGLQIFDFVRALRKGRITRAAEILGVSKHPSYHALVTDLSVRGQLRKQRFKNQLLLNRKAQKAILTDKDKMFADLFLEFHFGWSPLVADVYDSIDVLQRDIPAGRIIGRAKKKGVVIDISSISGGAKYTNKHCIDVDVVVGATVSVSNPNLALANQLGLVNPASLAWEVVPFSFIVDWFSTVGDFLGSFTEFAGYTINDPFTRTYTHDISSWSFIDNNSKAFGAGAEFEGWSANRVLSIPSVTLKMRSPWQISPMRAATAISLLVQQGFKR